MEKYLRFLKEKGADIAVIIDTDTIITAAWTIYKCQYGCSSYGKNLCCPPYAPSYKQTQEIIKCYSKAILFRTHNMNLTTSLAVETAGKMFSDDWYKAIAFGAGGCKKCSKCNLEYCNFPSQTVPSMEACGIDVFATVRANNLVIHTLKSNEETANYFGMILCE